MDFLEKLKKNAVVNSILRNSTMILIVAIGLFVAVPTIAELRTLSILAAFIARNIVTGKQIGRAHV